MQCLCLCVSVCESDWFMQRALIQSVKVTLRLIIAVVLLMSAIISPIEANIESQVRKLAAHWNVGIVKLMYSSLWDFRRDEKPGKGFYA